MIVVYTDGSCIKGNRGGYSAVITEDDKIITTLYQGFSNTTNNRQEIRGVLAALEYFKEPTKMTIVSDSQYVVNTIKQQWAQKWLREKDETKKNLDLWVKIVQLLEHHDVTIEWTKGHSVNRWNNLADLYAQHASQIINPIKDECENCTKKIGQSLVSSD